MENERSMPLKKRGLPSDGAILSGAIINLFNIPISTAAGVLSTAAHSGMLKTVCGIFLAALLVRAFAVRYLEKRQ